MSPVTSRREKITGFISKVLKGPNLPPASDTDSLLALGILDSIGFVQLVMFLEDEFGILIDESEILPENFENVPALERFVTAKLSAQAEKEQPQIGH